jgi:hypothetical protein
MKTILQFTTAIKLCSNIKTCLANGDDSHRFDSMQSSWRSEGEAEK